MQSFRNSGLKFVFSVCLHSKKNLLGLDDFRSPKTSVSTGVRAWALGFGVRGLGYEAHTLNHRHHKPDLEVLGRLGLLFGKPERLR